MHTEHDTTEDNVADLCRKHWTTVNRLRTGISRYRSPMEKWDWQTAQNVSVASQNRRLLASSTSAHYIDHHPKLASSKWNHWPENGFNTLSWQYDTTINEIIRRNESPKQTSLAEKIAVHLEHRLNNRRARLLDYVIRRLFAISCALKHGKHTLSVLPSYWW